MTVVAGSRPLSRARRIAAVLLVAVGLLIPAVAPIEAQLLGKISFPNSGAEEAQDEFVEGVLYLHNFEYEDAARRFRAARAIDPDFVLAYWGEAMTHNHPLWSQQDRAAARTVLESLDATAEARAARAATERERGYLAAAETLFGTAPETDSLPKEERDVRYREAMRRLVESNPEDLEARAFYALSILGAAHGGRDFATYMRAAAVADEVWERNREHPGAAHYLIHSYDDPVHAPLGLPMARVYARIAPAAAHAQHMTSHIFVALGYWQEVIDANIAARDVQNARLAELGKRPRLCSHYPYWLLYGYLQHGQPERAAEVLDACQERVRDRPDDGEIWHFRMMRARYAVDAGDVAALERWSLPEDASASSAGAGATALTEALMARSRNDAEALAEAVGKVDAYQPTRQWAREGGWKVARGIAGALAAAAAGERSRALEMLRKAAELEDDLPFAFGPPTLPKPAWELFGELLLEGGEAAEARVAFERQLERTPGRTAALVGLMRAARMSGDEVTAAEVEAKLADRSSRSSGSQE